MRDPDQIASPIVNIPTYHPIQGSREHYAKSIWIIHTSVNRKSNDSESTQYLIRHTVTRNANSHNSKHPPWPLPRSAPDMRPRGHSRQRNREGFAGPAGPRGWVRGVVEGRGEVDKASDRGNQCIVMGICGTSRVRAQRLHLSSKASKSPQVGGS